VREADVAPPAIVNGVEDEQHGGRHDANSGKEMARNAWDKDPHNKLCNLGRDGLIYLHKVIKLCCHREISVVGLSGI